MDNIEIAACNDLVDGILARSSISKSHETLNDYDCIVLPSPYKEDKSYYAQETIDFIKFCRESDNQFTIGILDNGNIETRSLHSFDIFMPILWVTTEMLLPIVVGVVSNYIFEKMKGREHEEANVELSFIVNRNDEKKMLHYKGPADEFKKAFDKIDLNEL